MNKNEIKKLNEVTESLGEITGFKVTEDSAVVVTYDNAEKGEGYYIDFVHEYASKENGLLANDAENVGFSTKRRNALKIANKYVKKYGVELVA